MWIIFYSEFKTCHRKAPVFFLVVVLFYYVVLDFEVNHVFQNVLDNTHIKKQYLELIHIFSLTSCDTPFFKFSQADEAGQC